VLPNFAEPTWFTNIASPKLFMNHKWTGVDISDGVDQADHPSRTTHIQTWQSITEGVQVEERVTSEY